METASPAPHTPKSDAVRNGDHSATRPSIEGSWEAFKVLCAEFLRAAGTANSEELEAGAKYVGREQPSIPGPIDHREAPAIHLRRPCARTVQIQLQQQRIAAATPQGHHERTH